MECWLPLLLQLTWDDVGGLSAVKQRLQEAVLWPQQHADALARLGATAPKGVLLYGPPGCSKTLLARAVAATAGLNFLSVKGGELYSKYVGESERAVAALFARARGAAPAIVFLDEIDALVSARGDGGGAGIGERVLAQLLTELDGLQVRSKGFMFWPRVLPGV
jgi:AAA family ATPase